MPQESRSELERILQVFNQTYILGKDNKFLEIDKELVKDNELLSLMSARLEDAALDEEVIENMLIEQEVDEVIDQHIKEKAEKDELIKKKDEELKAKNKLIDELQKQLKNKQS